MSILIVLNATFAFSQQNARYGCTYSPSGEIRILVVFADITNDMLNGEIYHWLPGRLPDYADKIIDENMDGSLVSYISKFYSEASFGTLRITGDYYPYLLEFDSSEIAGDGFTAVLNRMNNLPGDDIITQKGHHLSDFDNWSFENPRRYLPKNQEPDNRIDLLAIIWRRNSKYRDSRNGGTCISENKEITLKNMSGVNGYAILYNDSPSEILRHEFGHTLIGHNNYHTGGSGTLALGHFLSSLGGYSILSSHNHNLESCNGWDRWWLGWIHPEKNHDISALDMNGNEVNTDITCDSGLGEMNYVLRDFASSGDAVRIKLPHLQNLNHQTRNQYIWIENHQIKEGSIEYRNNRPKGIRLNIQIGNDNLSENLDSSRVNYLVPLSSFGNYDFFFDATDVPDPNNFTLYYRAFAYKKGSNPFSGYHPSMMPAIDYDNDGLIKPKELIIIWKLYLDDMLKCNDWTVYGNKYDAFPIGTKINISSNPATTPLLTYRTNSRPAGNELGSVCYTSPAHDDNRYIWLNGLCIEVKDIDNNGNIHIRILFNDYEVKSNVRWCGPIMSSEKVYVLPSTTLTLDYGFTPTRPINPNVINGNNIFASPTTLTCRDGSYFSQQNGSTVTVTNQSTLVLEAGSVYDVGDNALLDIKESGSLHVKPGATLRVCGTGRIDIRRGGYVCIEEGANILLHDTLASINLHNGHITGINPTASSPQGNCTDAGLADFALAAPSNGFIRTYENNLFIQNITYTHSAYETGATISAGERITTTKPYGKVTVESGAKVVFDGDGDVVLEPGVVVKPGGRLEIR